MQPNAKRIALEYFAQEKAQMPPTYFDKVNFTSDNVEKLIWHLANQKMQSNRTNSSSIFWNQVRLFKGFTEDVLDAEEFSWNEDMCDSVRTFNAFNQLFLGRLYVDKHLTDEIADKAAIAAWFRCVADYVAESMLDTEHKLAVERYSALMGVYFPGQVAQAGQLVQHGLSAAREYVGITKRQLDADENAIPITWDEFLALKGS